MATTPKTLTYEEWLAFPETEGVEEVVHGEIRNMPPNKCIHARHCRELADLLRARLDSGETVGSREHVFGLSDPCDPLDHYVSRISPSSVGASS